VWSCVGHSGVRLSSGFLASPELQGPCALAGSLSLAKDSRGENLMGEVVSRPPVKDAVLDLSRVALYQR